MNRNANSAASSMDTVVSRLAQFFPGIMRVRIPVSFSRVMQSSRFEDEEQTVIEFGTEREALFACSRPLEFEERISLRSADGTLQTEASVVAVQIGEGKTAVAVRFAGDVPNWIIR